MRCIASRKNVGMRCDGVTHSGEVLCPIHCADRDAGNDTYDVCIVPLSEFDVVYPERES